jgi:hypothetical protein
VSSQVKTDLENLNAEMEANNIPVNISQFVTGILGWAKRNGIIPMGSIMSLLLLCFTGCQSERAKHIVAQTTISVKALNDQHLSFEERFIEDYESKETTRILELYQAAVKSASMKVTQMVEIEEMVPVKAEDGTDAFKKVKKLAPQETEMVPANVMMALNQQKAELLTNMATIILQMRQTQAKICENAVNATLYLEGLDAYFSQKQITYESMAQAQQNLLSFIETFLTTKK